MESMLSNLDLTIVLIYAVCLFVAAQLVSSEEAGHTKDARDYFLAGKSLPWWAIGASLIASNISAEQIIGMSGSGYAIGMAIASYEWMGAATLLIVGKFLLPVFLRHEIFTMPQFLEARYDHRVRILMASFWVAVYIFVNLTSVLWLGALAINTVSGLPLQLGLLFLGIFALSYSFYGGLKAIALTDIVQVVLLVGGGCITVYILLDQVADGGGALAGFARMLAVAPDKFDMILTPDNPHYVSLPGISVLVGGMWVMNMSYWGFNQYIIQRALAAKDIGEAQKGIVFAAFLKILMPLIVVVPGVALFALQADLAVPDQAYPTAMSLLPTGLKGLVFAALLAAIVSSLASMSNSISTLVTLDLLPSITARSQSMNPVMIGRLVALAAMAIAMLSARPLLGSFDQAFQYIQEFTGFFTPGIVAIFLLGIFWRGTTATGALVAAASSVLLSLAFKLLWPSLPFIDRVGIVFLLAVALAVVASLFAGASATARLPATSFTSDVDFSTSRDYNVYALCVVLILAGLYGVWW